MQLHQLKPLHKKQRRKRIGRGGKRGTFSGRGSKGQKSRSGKRLKPIIRELIKRYPKLRGYKFNKRIQKSALVDLELLEKNFDNSSLITPEILFEKGLIRKMKGRIPTVKILGNKDIKKAFNVSNIIVSKSAKEKIEKPGGKVL